MHSFLKPHIFKVQVYFKHIFRKKRKKKVRKKLNKLMPNTQLLIQVSFAALYSKLRGTLLIFFFLSSDYVVRIKDI